MVKLSACIEPFFSELPYAERIRRVAELGFSAYEFWFHDQRFDGRNLVPEMKDFDQIAELNARYKLSTTDFVFNHPGGGVVASLIDAKDRPRLLDSIEASIGNPVPANTTSPSRISCAAATVINSISE